MASAETNAEALALQALVWTLGDESRARRLLDLTGLEPSDLRARAGDAVVLAATLSFLESYEPDLVACAEALEISPEQLVAARAILERA
ncbi:MULTISPECIES: DUF3572 domain-containing protein [Sphingomonas]|uniref:DUF3572 family protein n=1 Tax=Sphingomonas kyeonggiensis TaxID=1268553 RepID=A0A7W7NQ60_9SPHN|nr:MULTISPECIES: DUF3572 domain-containing protein [Sphingomonas]MBB4837573.1 hypothetical protein [Sphingomonas kyeonggiensis]WHU01899.1 DUF3572 domain-containing protein [Sphingomonas sp. NIBR02145]